MAEVLPLSETELRVLDSLLRHKIRFLIVGLSAADLWFEHLPDPKLSQALQEVGAAYIPPFGYNPPMIGGAGSEPFDVVIRMDGLKKFSTEWKDAIEITVGKLQLKVLSLERILTSKQAANRPKDQRIIPVLQNTLRTLEMKAKRKKKKRTPKNPVRFLDL